MEPDSVRDAVPEWRLDELANAGRENLDVDHVARYDDKEDADAPAEVALLRAIGMAAGSTVVEFGTGTGQFALAAAAAGARVVAVDVSPVMLARLHAKVERSGVGGIEVVRAGLLSYEHEGRPVDFVYTRLALHHLPDFFKVVALQRIHELLRPGGVLRLWDVVYGFSPSQAVERVDAWWSTGGDTADGRWSRAELAEHVRDEHSTFTWLLEVMIERVGFALEAAERSDDGITARYLLRRT